jgi:WS/DGAT/MGAT family acyltransferase
MPDRLTPLDASFLHLEDASSPMHVACVMTFAGEPPDVRELAERVESRLHLVPRYRHMLATVPLAQGRPMWVDDPDFDIGRHVKSTAVARPGGADELRALAGRLFSRQLRRDRPLWEMYVVTGLADVGGQPRFAIVSKTHHAVVDGISGLDVMSALFAPDEEWRDPSDWRPQPSPSGVERLAGALLERATSPTELIRPLRALVRRPRRVIEELGGALVGAGAFAFAGLKPAPRTPYNEKVAGPDREVAWLSVDLDDVKAIKNELGGTVNDVVLATVARALRRDLERRGVEPSTLRTFVPVSVRTPSDERSQPGNEVSGMLVDLPIGCPDAVECLHLITGVTKSMKDSGQALGAKALTDLSGLAPPTIVNVAMRLSARQRFVNLVVTNVPGPQQPLELDGRELLEILPMVPIGQNLRLTVAIVSYNGTMSFSVAADADLMPNPEEMMEDMRAGLAELADAAGISVREPERERAKEGVKSFIATPEAGAAKKDLTPEHPAAHVDTGVEEVAEFADPGAEDGAGAELHVDEPWPGYRRMTAQDVVDRLEAADEAEIAVVRLYESTHRKRRRVLEATDRVLRSA